MIHLIGQKSCDQNKSIFNAHPPSLNLCNSFLTTIPDSVHVCVCQWRSEGRAGPKFIPLMCVRALVLLAQWLSVLLVPGQWPGYATGVCVCVCVCVCACEYWGKSTWMSQVSRASHFISCSCQHLAAWTSQFPTSDSATASVYWFVYSRYKVGYTNSYQRCYYIGSHISVLCTIRKYSLASSPKQTYQPQ